MCRWGRNNNSFLLALVSASYSCQAVPGSCFPLKGLTILRRSIPLIFSDALRKAVASFSLVRIKENMGLEIWLSHEGHLHFSCRGLGFSAQHLHDNSQLPITPAPGNPMASPGLLLLPCGTHKLMQAHIQTHKES